jgi:hypothetical protein
MTLDELIVALANAREAHPEACSLEVTTESGCCGCFSSVAFVDVTDSNVELLRNVPIASPAPTIQLALPLAPKERAKFKELE